MNCDQVFAILTRGPFPSGHATDRAVEHHLGTCHECRHFADALRPHDRTDAESLLPEESRGLPFYWGVGALSGGESLVSTAVEGRSRSRRRRLPSVFQSPGPLERLSGWQLAFAVVMGALLGMLLTFVGSSDVATSEVASGAPVLSTSGPQLASTTSLENRLIEKLGVTPACLDRRLSGFATGNERYDRHDDAAHPYRPLAADGTTGRLHCCTECHNSTSPRLSMPSSTAKITRSCQVCHDDSPAQYGSR